MADKVQFEVDVVLNIVDKVTDKLNNINKATKNIAEPKQDFSKPIVQASKILGITTQQTADAFNKLGFTVNKNGEIFDKVTLKTISFNKSLKLIRKNAKRLDSDFGFLSLIFGGMFLERTFFGIFNNLSNLYKEVADENNAYIKAIDKLGGAFDFLKFTIFDAFANNELVQKILEKITNALFDLGKFFNDNPEVATAITATSLALGSLGAIFLTIGQGITLAKAFKEFSKFIGNIKNINITPLKDATTATKSFSSVIKDLSLDAITITAGAVLVFSGITDLKKWETDLSSSVEEGIFASLKTVFGSGLLGYGIGSAATTILSAFGIAVSAPLAAIGAVIGVTIGALISLRASFRRDDLSNLTNMLKTLNDEELTELENRLELGIEMDKKKGIGSQFLQSIQDMFGLSKEERLKIVKDFKKETTGFIGDTVQDVLSSNELQQKLENIDIDVSPYIDPELKSLTQLSQSLDLSTAKTDLKELNEFWVDNKDSLFELSNELSNFVNEGSISTLNDILEGLIDLTSDFSKKIITSLIPSLIDEKEAIDNLTQSYIELSRAKQNAGAEFINRQSRAEPYFSPFTE